MIDLVIPIVFMLLVVLGEALWLQWRRKGSVDWHDVIFNLNSGHIMLWLFRGLEIACYGYVVTHFNQGWLDGWPPVLMWLFAILAWDFGFYWLHRLHHRFRLLWAVHVVHHQGEQFQSVAGRAQLVVFVTDLDPVLYAVGIGGRAAVGVHHRFYPALQHPVV